MAVSESTAAVLVRLREQVASIVCSVPPEWDEYRDGFHDAIRTVLMLIDAEENQTTDAPGAS